MGKKRFARDPLLYIQQPKVHKTEAPMQSRYMTPKREKGIVANNKLEEGVAQKPVKQTSYEKHFNKPKQEAFQTKQEGPQPKRKKSFIEQREQTEETEEIEETEDTTERDNPIKFKDMTIEQKVDYFVNSSSFAPKMRCEIKTEERTYRGVITDKKEEDVFIRVGKRNAKLTMADIISIRMLGF